MTPSTARAVARIALCATLVTGAVTAVVTVPFLDPGAVANAAPSVVADDPNLSPAENALLAALPPDAAARFRLQHELQRRAEIADVTARLLQLRHDAATSVIDNIR